MEYVQLSNGVKMPQVGYGVFLMSVEECEKCVLDALQAGYRSIDTAQAYYNEEGVGAAIKESGITREELFITSKVWVSNAGYEKAKASIEESLKKLQTGYIDLLLVHQAYNDYYGTWRAMEEAYDQGKVKAIGVSNFYPDRFLDLTRFARVKPMVNQLEAHVFHQRSEIRPYLEKYNTQLVAWSPLARGASNLFNNPVLIELAQKYNKTTGQVALRFLIQNGCTVLPKTTHKERMEENIDVFDFTLDAEDVQKIKLLDTGRSLFMDHQNPEAMESFFERFKI